MASRKLTLENELEKYKISISTLQKIKDMYALNVNLYGSHFNNIKKELNNQILFCQKQINHINYELEKLNSFTITQP